MNINLNDDQMREVIGAAVLKTLSDDTRNTVIATAIDYLLREEPAYSGGKRISPIQRAFNEAIQRTAEKMAVEELEQNAEVKEKLRSLLHDAVDQLMANKEESVKRIANALSSAMTKRDDY